MMLYFIDTTIKYMKKKYETAYYLIPEKYQLIKLKLVHFESIIQILIV